MKIQEAKNAEEAIWSFVKNHRGYVLYPHELAAGEMADLHYHRRANEWLVISNGSFEVELAGEKKTFERLNGTIIIHFPKGRRHGLLAHSKIKYFVIRDKKDRNVYCLRSRK